jgi:hypothetical protein
MVLEIKSDLTKIEIESIRLQILYFTIARTYCKKFYNVGFHFRKWGKSNQYYLSTGSCGCQFVAERGMFLSKLSETVQTFPIKYSVRAQTPDKEYN